MRCVSERVLRSLKSHAKERRIQRTVLLTFLSIYLVPGHDNKHCPRRILVNSPTTLWFESKIVSVLRWGNWGSESLSNLHMVTQLGRHKAGLQPRSNSFKPSTYRNPQLTLTQSQVWEPTAKAFQVSFSSNQAADQLHATQFCRMSDLSWWMIITSHNVCNFSSWLFGYGCFMAVFLNPWKKCLAPKNTPSKLCYVASNFNLLRMKCTMIMLLKVGAAQDWSWQV